MPDAGRCSVSSTAVCKNASKRLILFSASSLETRRRDMMAESGLSNGAALAVYIAEVGERPLPPEVADLARLCLADWLGVAIGAGNEAAGRIVREVASGWGSRGRATILFGTPAAAPVAALA